jgi:hypothetical protein
MASDPAARGENTRAVHLPADLIADATQALDALGRTREELG